MANATVTNTFVASTTAVASQVNTNFTDVLNVLNGTSGTLGALSGGSIANDVMAVQRLIHQNQMNFAAGLVVGTYYSRGTGAGALTSGSATASASEQVATFSIASSDYLVANRTTKMQIRVSIAVNATAPTSTFTFGLYPVTVAGGSSVLAATLGTVVSGSTVAFVAPSASTMATAASGTFTIPANGAYILGCTTTIATTAASSLVSATSSLFVSHA